MLIAVTALAFEFKRAGRASELWQERNEHDTYRTRASRPLGPTESGFEP